MSLNWLSVGKVFLDKTSDILHFSRVAYWYFHSSKDYTKSAYLQKSESFKKYADIDMKGKSIMVLGSTGILGSTISKYLAQKEEITLYFLFNDEIRGENLINSLKAITGKNTKIIPQKLDFSDIQKVKDYVNEFIQAKKDLHILINSATSVMINQLKDEKGTDKSFLINVLSPYIIISKFSEYLSATNDQTFVPRVVNITCGNILTVNIHVNDIELRRKSYKPLFFYSHEKKQHTVLINIFPSKYPKIHFFNVIPGWIDISETNQILPEMVKSLRSDLRTPEQGIDTVLWVALSEEALKYRNGEIFMDRMPYKTQYMNTPNFLKAPMIVIYMTSITRILSRYETPRLDLKEKDIPSTVFQTSKET